MIDGYEVMANLWYIAIQEVMANCWLTPPVAVSGMNDSDIQRVDTTCDPDPTNFPAPIQIQKGSGYNDSNYQYVQLTSNLIITMISRSARSLQELYKYTRIWMLMIKQSCRTSIW